MAVANAVDMVRLSSRWLLALTCVSLSGLVTVGCATESDVSFGGAEDGVTNASRSTDPTDPTAIECTPGDAACEELRAEAFATNKTKDNGETDVDCGGANAPACATGKTCVADADCADVWCASGLCAVPRADDGVKNGGETDVDCGGPKAPKCETGKVCGADADCEGACNYDKKCVEASSCRPHAGGDTCGAGEVGNADAKHESCCRSLPVAGYTEAGAAGKTVYLDKYEITAGRVREFVADVTKQYGKPDLKRWVAEHKPAVWGDQTWDAMLATDADNGVVAGGSVGTDAVFGNYEYFHVHGSNCLVTPNAYGFPTYWYPDEIMSKKNSGVARAIGQEVLDAKAMNCIPNAVLAAFCAWDGGQLASPAALDAATNNGQKLPAQSPNVANISSDSGQHGPYYFPNDVVSTADGADRVAAPGRMTGDRTASAGAEGWMDLRGNMNEITLNPANKAFQMKYQGIGYSSAHAGGNTDAKIARPDYKAAYSGGRCMRLR